MTSTHEPSTLASREVTTANGADASLLIVEYHPAEVYLAGIELHPDHQGHGIGATLARVRRLGRPTKPTDLTPLTPLSDAWLVTGAQPATASPPPLPEQHQCGRCVHALAMGAARLAAPCCGGFAGELRTLAGIAQVPWA